jgi:hypothetical protein
MPAPARFGLVEKAATNVHEEPFASIPEDLERRIPGKEIAKHLRAAVFSVGAPLVKRLKRLDREASNRHGCEAMLAWRILHWPKIPLLETLDNEATETTPVTGRLKLAVPAQRD